MARAIRTIVQPVPTKEEIRQAAHQEISDALTANPEAIVQLVRLVQQLQENELLNMVNAALEQGPGVIQVIVDQAKKPEYAGGVKNVMGMLQLLGKLDISLLDGMLGAATQAAQQVEAGKTETLGVFKLMGMMKDPDVSAGLSFMIETLRGVGRTLREK
jgi:uncharacterized protein YjgD (DUF1641 family)